MKIQLIILLAILKGFMTKNTTSNEVPAPNIKEIVYYRRAFDVKWDKVESKNKTDPVLGYVIKMWEIPDQKILIHKYVNGEDIVVEEWRPTLKSINEMREIPKTEPKIYEIDNRRPAVLHINDTSALVSYDLRIMAYTASVATSLSDPIIVKNGE